MSKAIKCGGQNEIPAVEVKCEGDVFENSIRSIGVVFACEWFGHDEHSDFTASTIAVLCERSGISTEE